MKSAIARRELITLLAERGFMQGTYHRPARPADQNRIGVLLLNPGILPRAATGDSAVYWADSFAEQGYGTVRFDLPGLGDSPGDAPTEVLEFQDRVNTGHYGTLLGDVVEEFAKRFKLSGVVILGHCAGAVSALYAAARSPHVRGLVLLDPYFHLQQPIKSSNLLTRWQLRTHRKLESDLETMQTGSPTPRGSYLRLITAMYKQLKSVGMSLRYGRLPGTANHPLIRCWIQLVSTGLPILVLKSVAWTRPVGEFDYYQYLEAVGGIGSQTTIIAIEGTTHSFADGLGKLEVRRHTENWLSERFPQTARGEAKAQSGPELPSQGLHPLRGITLQERGWPGTEETCRFAGTTPITRDAEPSHFLRTTVHPVFVAKREQKRCRSELKSSRNLKKWLNSSAAAWRR